MNETDEGVQDASGVLVEVHVHLRVPSTFRHDLRKEMARGSDGKAQEASDSEPDVGAQ